MKPTRFVLLFMSMFYLAAWLPCSCQQTVGVFLNTEEAEAGYTFFAPVGSTDTFLIDMEGRLVRR